MTDRDKLIEQTGRDVQRLEQREKAPAGLVGMLLYGGVLGLLFVVPIVAGAYLGRWLDSLAPGYSVRWTLSLLLLGIVVGGYNVWRLLKGRE